MENLFDGLLLYEITLLILGVVLFLILSIGLLYYIIKKEQIAKLLFFFFIPIVMIGYPSITQITISNDRIELSKLQNKVIEDPEDSVAVQKMEQLTEKLEKRASTTDELVQIGTSNLLLGNNERAENLADEALTKDKTNEAARDVKDMAILQQRIREIPVQEEAAPAREETNITTSPQIRDDTAKVMVNSKVKTLQQMEVTNDLTKVKSFLIKRSTKNLNTIRESEK